MADVVTGYHWSETSPEKITGAKLNLTGSGSVTNITQTDLGSGFTGITIGTAAPSPPVTGLGWFDTTQGAGRGILKFYDNGKWAPVAVGFLGFNTGTTLSRGHIVQYDSATTPATVGTIPVSKTAAPSAGVVQLARPRGVAAESIANSAYGVILTEGYAQVLKETGTVTAGDLIVPSSTVGASSNGRGESGNVGSWGATGGHAGIGRWLDTSSAVADTLVSAIIYPPSGSWTVFKNSGGTVLANAAVPVLNAWTNTPVALPTSVPGTIAHICQFFITSTTAAATGIIVGLRMANATVDVGTGAAHMRGVAVGSGAPTNYQGMGGQLIVAETTGAAANTMQYFVNSSAAAATFALTINHVGCIVGGSIV